MRSILLFLFSHRTLALIRWDLHFLRVRLLNFIFRRSSVIGSFLSKPGRKFMNLGSGPRGLDSPEWLNLDGFPEKTVHYMCDFGRPIPVPASSLDGIFTEHVVEHFTYEQARVLLSQCRDMLKQGGVIRIIVPDGRKFLKCYFEEPERILEYKECSTPHAIEAVNAWFYQRFEHQFIYDADMLRHLLLEIGFRSAEQVSFGNTSTERKELVLDDSKYAWESLYVEAVK